MTFSLHSLNPYQSYCTTVVCAAAQKNLEKGNKICCCFFVWNNFLLKQ